MVTTRLAPRARRQERRDAVGVVDDVERVAFGGQRGRRVAQRQQAGRLAAERQGVRLELVAQAVVVAPLGSPADDGDLGLQPGQARA